MSIVDNAGERAAFLRRASLVNRSVDDLRTELDIAVRGAIVVQHQVLLAESDVDLELAQQRLLAMIARVKQL